MEDPIDPDDNRTAKLKIAHGIMWLLIWTGVGICLYLSSQGKLVEIQFK